MSATYCFVAVDKETPWAVEEMHPGVGVVLDRCGSTNLDLELINCVIVSVLPLQHRQVLSVRY